MKHEKSAPMIVLVGHPNVGKSALFNRLCGGSATVSNYPGTTVEIERGRLHAAGREFELIDSPGMYSLLPVTEEERVARQILIKREPFLVLHVADAKNLERMLPLTLQLLEGGLPTLLVLNMMDEAHRLGLHIDLEALQVELGVPVVATVSITGRGIDELRRRIISWVEVSVS